MHLQGLKNVGAMGNVKNNFIIFNGTSYNALPIDANGMTLATTAPTPPTNQPPQGHMVSFWDCHIIVRPHST